MNKKAFSLLEIMIVCTILGVIAGFAIPAYKKSVSAAQEKNLRAQLIMIHGANLSYKSHNGSFWDTGGSSITDINDINANLGISLMATDISYAYKDTASGYIATATWDGNTLTVVETEIADGSDPNYAKNPY